MHFENTIEFAKALDAVDPLRAFRNKFIIPKNDDGQEKIYFLGNSLGLQPISASGEITKVLGEWAQKGVESFFEGDQPWMSLHDQLTPAMAQVVGALPEEIVIMNQLTVNLHLMLASFYRPQGIRRKILCEAGAFPSDQYMLRTHLQTFGLDPDSELIEVPADAHTQLINEEKLINTIYELADQLALVLVGGVNYYTGQVLPMQRITQAAHAVGANAGFDLAHAAGNTALHLHDWEVDFACWCNYKYLNCGPGAVATVYIHQRYHNDDSIPRLGGWWGQNKQRRFLMEKKFDPIRTAEGWQVSTPSIPMYALCKASLKIFEQAGIERLIDKSRLMSAYMHFLLNDINQRHPGSLNILTPAEPQQQGAQVSIFMLRDGRKIFDDLTRSGIFCDWREPNVIRVAPVPLYNTFEEIWSFCRTLSLLHDKGAIN